MPRAHVVVLFGDVAAVVIGKAEGSGMERFWIQWRAEKEVQEQYFRARLTCA
jgi:hypothetical protein